MDGISHVRALLGRTSYDTGVAPHIPNTVQVRAQIENHRNGKTNRGM
jgi:hypothetical protein